MKKYFNINSFIIILGILTVMLRILDFIIDDYDWDRIEEFVVLFLLILLVILFIFALVLCFKKKFKPILLISLFIAVQYAVPWEFVTGYIKFLIIKNEREILISNLNAGKYNSIINSNSYSDGGGTWLTEKDTKMRCQVYVYKDNSLQLIKIPAGSYFLDLVYQKNNYFISNRYGSYFYISNISKIKDKRVENFIWYEYELTYLGDNWYWLYTYCITTPAP